MEPTNSHMEDQGSRAKSFGRLQEELVKATQASKEKIQQWECFKADYEALQARLYSLPDQLTHDVMVPFGKFAFMPGQIYHTNEILVLLGDNWFTKRSVKQALEIAERRKQNVIKSLEEEQKQFTDYEARKSFTADFQSTVGGHEDTVEIKEKYSHEEEERWKKRRARTARGGKVPPPRQVFPRQISSTSASIAHAEEKKKVSRDSTGTPVAQKVFGDSSGTSVAQARDENSVSIKQFTSDEELWRRLDELEREEEEAQELEEESGGDNIMVKKRTAVQLSESTASVQVEESENVSRQSAQSLRPQGESKGDNTPRGPLRIAVKHTTPLERGEETNAEERNPRETENKPVFKSPADIFQQATVKEETVSSSERGKATSAPQLAKGVRWDPELVSFSDTRDSREPKREGKVAEGKSGVVPTTIKPPAVQARAPMPFSGQVIERSSPAFPAPAPSGSSKVSKFKASRQKK